MGKRGRSRKISHGEAEETEAGGHLITPTAPDGVTHQQAANPIPSPPSTDGERSQGKLTMGKRGGGRPRKRSNGEEAEEGKSVHRGRLRKGSKGGAEEEKSGHLITPTSISHQKVSNSISSPLGFLSVPKHYPPAPSRYPRRSGKAVPDQSAPLTTPSTYPFRRAKGVTSHDSTLTSEKTIPAETTDTSKLPFQTQASNTPAASSWSPSRCMKSEDQRLWDTRAWLKDGKPTENINYSETAESEDWSMPTENDLTEIENLTSGLLLQIQAQEKVQPAAASPSSSPLHDDVVHNHPPIGEATVTLDLIENGQEVVAKNVDQKVAPTPSGSLNLTEMAAMAYDDSSDEEVRSALDVALVTVSGYRVKEECASLLREIISNYGDIAKDSSFQSGRSRSSLLELVCGIFQKLQGLKFTEISPTELKSMLDLVADIESVRVEVGWLRKRLEEIYEAKLLLKGSSSLKEEKTRIREAIEKAEREVEGYKAEMLRLQENISLVEDKLAAMKAASEKVNEIALDTKTKVKCFYQRCLVHGLL